MNKIRINVLARELEVKAHELLDKLPELGVTEKKTHSSSIDDDVAEKLRHIFGGTAGAAERAEQSASNGAAAATEEAPSAAPQAEKPHAVEAVHETESPREAVEEKLPPRIGAQPQRLRPPLATSSPTPQVPTASTPGVPVRPVPPPPRPIPAAPRPGQIPSGPPQPLPGGLRPPDPVRVASGPAAPVARSAAPPAQSPARPGAAAPPNVVRTVPTRPGLAGQPP